MTERIKIVKSFYDKIDEDSRLCRSRHGQMEYLTTMHYIHRFAQSNSKILEIGAGTGRYSIALAKEGQDVTAVELVKRNLEILRKNGSCSDVQVICCISARKNNWKTDKENMNRNGNYANRRKRKIFDRPNNYLSWK